MAGFRTQYTRLNSNSDDPEEDLPPQDIDIGTRGFEEVEKGDHECIFFRVPAFVRLSPLLGAMWFVYMYGCHDCWFLGGKDMLCQPKYLDSVLNVFHV